MQSRGCRWMLYVLACMSSLVTVLAVVPCVSAAGEPQVLHNTRPPDTLAERLERPRPEQDSVQPGARQPQLTQNEVVKLAQTTAKQKLGTSYEEYELKVVRFDQKERSWSVTFTQGRSSSVSEGCLIVSVHDDSRERLSHSCR